MMKKCVILSGAGISADSGLKTFRDAGGLWEGYKVEEVCTPEAYARNPQLVIDFYNHRRRQANAAQPNEAHKALVALEPHYRVEIVTQNVDDLHERAGSSNVLHLHGNIRLAKSSGHNAQYSQEFYPITSDELKLDRDLCPLGYPLRPHVVWFGEAVPAYDEAIQIIQNADIFIVIGSTLTVYPVAGLIHEISKQCQAFYIDPQADHSRVPHQYQCLKMTATEGMHQILKLI